MEERLLRAIRKGNSKRYYSTQSRAPRVIYMTGDKSTSSHRSSHYGNSVSRGSHGKDTIEIVVKGPPSSTQDDRSDLNCFPHCHMQANGHSHYGYSACYPNCGTSQSSNTGGGCATCANQYSHQHSAPYQAFENANYATPVAASVGHSRKSSRVVNNIILSSVPKTRTVSTQAGDPFISSAPTHAKTV
jgi:hypothetical protein